MTAWLQALPEPTDIPVVTPPVNLPGIEDLLPIALLCALSIVCTLLWLLAERKYTGHKRRNAAGDSRGAHDKANHAPTETVTRPSARLGAAGDHGTSVTAAPSRDS